MATNTILLGGFTNCDAFAYGSQDISQVWFGNSLVWSATSGSPETSAWISIPTGMTVLGLYTPVSNMYISAASMITDNTQSYNYLNGVWRLSGNIAVKVAAYTSSNNAPVNIGTVDGSTAWKHTFNFPASAVYLSAGVPYLIHIGYNYFNGLRYLNDEATPYWTNDWSMDPSNSQTWTLTSSTSGMYLQVN